MITFLIKESIGFWKNRFIKMFFLLFFVLSLGISATETIEWKEGTEVIYLGKHLSILEDQDKKLQLSDVRSVPYSEKFLLSNQEVPNFGVTESAFWVHFIVKNPAQKPILLVLEVDQAQYDEVEFYSYDSETEQFTKTVTGDQHPFASRPMEYYNYLFPIELPASSEKEMYFRLIMNGPTIIPINLWEPKSFFSHSILMMCAFGAFFGIMGIMCIYNLFLYLSVKDISYLYYVFVAGGILQATLTFTGLDAQYFWRDSPFFGEYIHHVGIVGTPVFACFLQCNF